MEKIIRKLNEASFNQLMDDTDKLIVVEFYTTTCPVCRSMEPIFQNVAEGMKDDVVFVKVNAATNQSLASFHEIMGVPTFKFFCHKELLRELQGEVNQTIMTNTIKDILKYVAQCNSKPRIYEMDGYG